MLNEQTIDRLAERLTNRIEELNVRILKQIGNDIAKIGTLTPTDAQKLGNILKYGGSYEKIAKEVAKITGLNIEDVYQIFEEVSKIDQNFAKIFYEYRNVDFIPYDQNIALKRQTESLARLTASEFANFSNANILGYGLQDEFGNVTYRGIRETYNQLIDEAILSISQGKETFNEVMYKQIKQMGSGGLKIIYPSTYIGKDSKGNPVVKHHTRRLDSVVRSSILEGIRTLHNANQELFGEEFGYNGIEVTHHQNSAPDHIDTVDGKQFALIDKIQEQINDGIETEIKQQDIRGNQVRVNGKWYDDFNAINNSLDRQVSTLNCRHRIFSIVVGVSKPEYTQEQLDEDKQKNIEGFTLDGKHYSLYEGEQLQRSLERRIREQKDIQIIAKTSGNKELVQESQSKITQLTRKYKQLSDVSGLPTKMERMRVSGYKRVKVDIPKMNNYKEIEYAKKNNTIWHSTESLEEIMNDDKIITPSIAVGKEMNTKIKYGTQFIEFKPEILENVNKKTVLYNGDGGNQFSNKASKFDNLMQMLKDKPKNYNELKFNNDLESLKYIKKVYIRQDEPKELIKLLRDNNIEYEIYEDYRIRGFKKKK